MADPRAALALYAQQNAQLRNRLADALDAPVHHHTSKTLLLVVFLFGLVAGAVLYALFGHTLLGPPSASAPSAPS